VVLTASTGASVKLLHDDLGDQAFATYTLIALTSAAVSLLTATSVVLLTAVSILAPHRIPARRVPTHAFTVAWPPRG
jgi:hypothetical protein